MVRDCFGLWLYNLENPPDLPFCSYMPQYGSKLFSEKYASIRTGTLDNDPLNNS